MSDDVSDAIMAATYRALCARGYAELTMQDIADETDKSKAALHYHYDSKHDLLVAFLEYLFERFTDRVADPAGETPAERLAAFVDTVLSPPPEDADERVAFRTALLELKAQAPYNDDIRERLEQFDQYLFEHVHEHVAAGIEAGEFRPVDPDDTARFIVTALDGAHTKQVAVGQDIDCTRRMLRSYVETHLVAGDADDTDDGEDNRGDDVQEVRSE
ncbi:TetR/AcrR family transcriptional regulator [Halorientalis salina]|uniref:TetR/AcrR family transcriptional regulator n=1 Tax=Halorientalis salina TaxID=2932266 RepID=UPI0010AD9797|nr:TetR/AcrR family transcriptional regulator [Halorientalis salina]